MSLRIIVVMLAFLGSLITACDGNDAVTARPRMSVSGTQPMPPVGTDLTEEFRAHARSKNGNVPNLVRAEIVANPDGKREPIMRVTIEKKIEVAEQHWWLNEAALWMMGKGYAGFAEVYDAKGQRLA